ncbi:MAG: cob(I)yrinic acid a,c-diamide adenosyltransferase [Parcubacteria group bacterium]|nr:cob(I)yrinic acid a,c-diamide adenosyltransferase [Parcubacteria group bacterium]
MTLFYTRKGDDGSSMVSGKKIPKNNIVFETLGDLDELNSVLGIARTRKIGNRFKKTILAIQNDLFIIQAQCASLLYREPYARTVPKLTADKIFALEQLIDSIDKKTTSIHSFIIPGSSIQSSWFDFARAVARRAERRVAQCAQKYTVDHNILSYMNRLSSLLFALARLFARGTKKKESHPTY